MAFLICSTLTASIKTPASKSFTLFNPMISIPITGTPAA